MLCVPTFVASSPIAGMGVFSATDLPAGKIIWEFTEGVDWCLSKDEFSAFPEPYRTRLGHYLYESDSGVLVLCGDNAKFMNHADQPNCDDTGQVHTVTRRSIAAGEELTCDYRAFDRTARARGLAFATGA